MRIEFPDNWYYDFDEMTISEQLRAKTYWILYLRGLELMPSNPSEEAIFLLEANETRAVASLLKKDEPYTLDEAINLLHKLKGSTWITKIEEAKQDFFGRPTIGSAVSIYEFKNFLSLLEKMPGPLRDEMLKLLAEGVPEVLKMLDKTFLKKD